MTRFTLTWVLLAAFPVVSQAGPDVFNCKVLSLSELSKKGTFETGAEYQKEQIGSTFSVERKTGAIRGGYFLNNRSSKNRSGDQRAAKRCLLRDIGKPRTVRYGQLSIYCQSF